MQSKMPFAGNPQQGGTARGRCIERLERIGRIGLVLLGALLLGDAVGLMSLGLFNFGVILPTAIGAAFLLLGWRWPAVARWRAARRWRQRLWRAGWTAFGLWLVSVAVFFHTLHGEIVAAAPEAAAARATAAKSIVILGAGTPNCAASPTLAARLDAGLMLARQLPAAWVVVSGGEDFLRGCREADVMADYLLARGLAPIRLIREGRATSTDENLRFSRELLAQQGVPATEPVIVVTSDFHLMRAERIARKAGFTQVAGAAAPTPLYLRYNAWLREYFALISGRLLGEY